MDNKIEIDFSKLEKSVVLKPRKTIWALSIAGIVLIVPALYMIFNKTDICDSIVIIYVLLALIMVALCYIIYKAESIQIYHSIDEAKADANLRRKLAEDAIMRETKIREKEISNTI